MQDFDTPLTRLLSIRYPLVQAPVGSASTPELVAAVSNAGALGMLSITWRSLEETRQVIRETRHLTDKPFGVNLVLHWDPAERLAIALEEGVPIVSFFWGDPSPWIAHCHAAGALVFATIGAPGEAARVAASGVDVIVAQGWEAGGHVWGEMTTMSLVPATVDAVKPLPVVAAGGIGDGRGIAAALALGAAGAWLGTRFLFAAETPLHPFYRDRLLQASGEQTVHSTIFDQGWPDAPVRTLRNSTWEQWRSAGEPSPGRRPGEEEVITWHSDGEPILRYASAMPMAGMTGNVEALAMYAGQAVGLNHEIQPAAVIVDSLMTETKEVIAAMNQRLGAGQE